MNHHPFQIEAMEARMLLDATAVLGKHGIFKVTGTDAGEAITVALSDDGTKVVASVDGTGIGEAELSSVKGIFISAGDGDDTVTIDAAVTLRAAVAGGAGNDTLTAGGGDSCLVGGDGDDVLSATTGRTLIHGGDGNDIITSTASTSRLFGGAGDDTITGSAGDDTIYGGDGTDSLSGGDGGTDSVNAENPQPRGRNRFGHGAARRGPGACI